MIYWTLVGLWFIISNTLWAWQVQKHYGKGLKAFAIFTAPATVMYLVVIVLVNT